MQQRARKSKALLLAEREHPVPVAILVKPPGEVRQPHRNQCVSNLLGRYGAVFSRIDHGVAERAHREIRTLRQHHQPGLFGDGDPAGAERPDAGDCAEQRGFARAGWSGHQHTLRRFDREGMGRDEWLAVRQLHQQLLERDGLAAAG